MHPMRSYNLKRLYLKVVIRQGYHHLVGWWQHQLRLGRRLRSRRTQVLDLAINGLLVAHALLIEPAPLAPGLTPDSFALFPGRIFRRYSVCRNTHFGSEQGGKENSIPVYK
jgi:hypothetical protein